MDILNVSNFWHQEFHIPVANIYFSQKQYKEDPPKYKDRL